MPIRLQDIADDLNLSAMTISRVLRGQAAVSAATKARVLKRVKELNYRPNVAARGLRTGQSSRLGVLVPFLSDRFCAGICQGLALALQDSGYGLHLALTGGDARREEQAADLQLALHVDLLLMVLPEDADRLATRARESRVPAFLIGRQAAQPSLSSVHYDEMQIGRLAARHLLLHGARRIAYLRGPRTVAGDARRDGFLLAHHELGVPARLDWAVEPKEHASDYGRGFAAASRLLAARPMPDAFMGNTDGLAAGARDAALARGLEIPGSLQVVGCGDDALVCSVGLPLSSVSWPGEELGQRAGKLALRLLGAKKKTTAEPVRTLRLNPVLVQRMTTRNSPGESAGWGKETGR